MNLHVDNEKVAIYHWREPFATLVKATEIQAGGAEATAFEHTIADLAQWFIDHSAPAWRRELQVAGNIIYEPAYRY